MTKGLTAIDGFDAWRDFVLIRATQFSSTRAFCQKFRACLNRLNEFDDLMPPEMMVIAQFQIALEPAFPEYFYMMREGLRRGRKRDIGMMINDIIDEAHWKDRIKEAFDARVNKQSGGGAGNNNAAKRSWTCKECGRKHVKRFNTPCYFTHPELAPPEWRERHR